MCVLHGPTRRHPVEHCQSIWHHVSVDYGSEQLDFAQFTGRTASLHSHANPSYADANLSPFSTPSSHATISHA